MGAFSERVGYQDTPLNRVPSRSEWHIVLSTKSGKAQLPLVIGWLNASLAQLPTTARMCIVALRAARGRVTYELYVMCHSTSMPIMYHMMLCPMRIRNYYVSSCRRCHCWLLGR